MEALLKLGVTGSETTLSDDNREFSTGEKIIVREVRTASGKLKKDVIARKNTFNINWSGLAHNASNTGDGNAGREELKTETDKDTMLNFIVRSQGTGQDAFTVSVSKYDEQIKNRLGDSAVWLWDISLELEEQ